MEFEKVVKTFDLHDFHPELSGEIQIWVNPTRRVIKLLVAGEPEKFREGLAEVLCLDSEEPDFDEWPTALYQVLVGTSEIRGLIWRKFDEHRDEILKNIDGGSDSSKTG